MKTGRQKTIRDEFRERATGRVMLASDWTSGSGRYTAMRPLPEGVKHIRDIGLFKLYDLPKVVIRDLFRLRKKYPRCRSFLVISDLRKFNK